MTGGDDGRFALALNRAGDLIPLPRGGRSRVVEDIRRRGRSCAARVAHRRRVHLSEGARAGAAHRRGRRRHLRAGGTEVRMPVHTDLPAATGRMVLAGDQTIALTRIGDACSPASLQITEDSSYRVALADAEGLTSRGDTEYFIRTLDDRPPEVHVRAAGERSPRDAARRSRHRGRGAGRLRASRRSISSTPCAAAPRRSCRCGIPPRLDRR